MNRPYTVTVMAKLCKTSDMELCDYLDQTFGSDFRALSNTETLLNEALSKQQALKDQVCSL